MEAMFYEWCNLSNDGCGETARIFNYAPYEGSNDETWAQTACPVDIDFV